MSPGCAGTLFVAVTLMALEALDPQEFLAITEIELLVLVVAGVVTVIVLVFCPLLIVQLAGTVQIYSVALVIAGMEYSRPVLLLHTFVGPLIDPVITGAGSFNPTVIDCELLFPQLLFATTESVPPEEPAFTLIEFVPCPVLIDNPEVAVQV